MSLIVEDGTARSDSEAYISVTDADAYFAARGNTSWAALGTPAKEAALRNATEFMGQRYRLRWQGFRVLQTQALDWPRYEVPMPDAPGGYGSFPAYYDYKSVPQAVQRACAELALRASAGPLSPDVGAQKAEVTVGPITTKYVPGTRQSTLYTAVEALLLPLLKGSASSISVVRA
jgi:hypothetical protein